MFRTNKTNKSRRRAERLRAGRYQFRKTALIQPWISGF